MLLTDNIITYRYYIIARTHIVVTFLVECIYIFFYVSFLFLSFSAFFLSLYFFCLYFVGFRLIDKTNLKHRAESQLIAAW